MTNVQVFGFGALIALGMALHGALSRPPAPPAMPGILPGMTVESEVARIQGTTARVQALIAHRAPTALTLGDHALIAQTNWKQDGGDISITTDYYEYRDGKLVEVPTVSTAK